MGVAGLQAPALQGMALFFPDSEREEQPAF